MFLLSSKLTFSKNYFRNTTRVSNSSDPDQDRRSVGPDLGPNCLQRLSANVTASKERVILNSFNRAISGNCLKIYKVMLLKS